LGWQGIVFEENSPEYGGLYVAELAAGGAAAVTGAVSVADQLVAVGGTRVTGEPFEAVMNALGTAPSPAALRFFRGTAAELAAAAVADKAGVAAAPAVVSAARPDATILTVVQSGAPDVTVTVKGEKLLRNVLLEKKVESCTILVTLSSVFAHARILCPPCNWPVRSGGAFLV
jgi:C-terminal processing protease CtpA/Prc